MKVNSVFAKSTSVFVLILSATLSWANPAQSSQQFSTGFERSQGFVIGPLNGQQKWQGSPDAAIESAVQEVGHQSLLIASPPSATGGYFEFANAPYQFNSISNRHASFKVAFNRVQNTNVQAGMSIVSNAGFLGGIFSGADGAYFLGNFDSNTDPVTFENGVWHDLSLVFDFKLNTVTGSVDGISLGTLPLNPPNGTLTRVSQVQLYAISGTNNPIESYFDQLEINYNYGAALRAEPSHLCFTENMMSDG